MGWRGSDMRLVAASFRAYDQSSWAPWNESRGGEGVRWRVLSVDVEDQRPELSALSWDLQTAIVTANNYGRCTGN